MKDSEIVVWEKELSELFRLFREKEQSFLFTDENVLRLYGNFQLPYYAMAAGEENKTKETLFSLLESMERHNLLRNAHLICMGGGVVTDLGGLAAAVYMRGIRHSLVPTTLLAQADASIGGKCGINFCGVKNLLGSFYPPDAVYFSSVFFQTLPKREIVCGMGEIIKCGALDRDFFEFLWAHREEFETQKFLGEAVERSVRFKRSVTERDPYDTGLRRCLNLGHTTAHVLEMSGLGLNHGESVLYGMVLESGIAKSLGANVAFEGRLKTLCRTALGSMPPLALTEDNLRLALFDKKNQTDKTVRLVIATEAGEYREAELPFSEYASQILKEMETL